MKNFLYFKMSQKNVHRLKSLEVFICTFKLCFLMFSKIMVQVSMGQFCHSCNDYMLFFFKWCISFENFSNFYVHLLLLLDQVQKRKSSSRFAIYFCQQWLNCLLANIEWLLVENGNFEKKHVNRGQHLTIRTAEVEHILDRIRRNSKNKFQPFRERCSII